MKNYWNNGIFGLCKASPSPTGRRLGFLLVFYAASIILFWMGRTFFVARCFQLDSTLAYAKLTGQTCFHGLPLDIATAGYLATPPFAIMLLSIWMPLGSKKVWHRLHTAYLIVLAVAMGLILAGDAMLYPYWGFKIDATIFNYLSQPSGAIKSVSAAEVALFCVSTLLFALLGLGLWKAAGNVPTQRPAHKLWATLLMILVGALMFVGIRGGIGRSTANVGLAYYSNNVQHNHAAVNPAFSIFSTIKRNQDYGAAFNYFDEARRAHIFETMGFSPKAPATARLKTKRVNVVVIIMEGMGAQFVESLGGKAGVTPNLERLKSEGLWFTRCYANSFRTDRGTVSTLSGYPAVPTVSVMRLQHVVNRLPGIAATLAKQGYDTEFLYGGDIDFTGTKGYLLATGYKHLYSETHFPISVRRSHAWGVTDAIAFDTLFQHIMAKPARKPWHIGFLTLASHEPWQVPYNRIKGDERANAFAYLDHCLGHFIDRLKTTPQWENLLIVIMPDHGIRYPTDITELNPQKHHIPMLWTGGAIVQPEVIDHLCNQSDMAATLLGQLRLPIEQFTFSRNILSPDYKPCAFYTWSGGVAAIDTMGYSIIDTEANQVAAESPGHSTERLERAKAYLQTIYDDLGK